MTKPVEFRNKTPDQLETQLLDLKREQFNLRFRRASGEGASGGRQREVRRDIARVKTILAEKQRSAVTNRE